jgi:hypothetical protein
MVQGSGFMVQGPGFRVQGSGFRVLCSGNSRADSPQEAPDHRAVAGGRHGRQESDGGQHWGIGLGFRV